MSKGVEFDKFRKTLLKIILWLKIGQPKKKKLLNKRF